MTQSLDKEVLLNKWKPILERYSNYENNGISDISSSLEFPSLLPMSMRIAAETIGTDLVSVQPMKRPGGTSEKEMDRIKNEVKSKNRDGKIDSIIEGNEYVEEKIEDHPDYNGPRISLMYLDYSYNSTSSKI